MIPLLLAYHHPLLQVLQAAWFVVVDVANRLGPECPFARCALADWMQQVAANVIMEFWSVLFWLEGWHNLL